MQNKDSGIHPYRLTGGFTLTELVIVMAIVAILVALAVPSFSAYVRKGKRAEAQQLLMNWANNQEIWRANHSTYASSANLPVPTHKNYTFTISNVTATTYTLTATPTGDQAYDKDQSISCSPLALNQSGSRSPKKSDGVTAACWGNY